MSIHTFDVDAEKPQHAKNPPIFGRIRAGLSNIAELERDRWLHWIIISFAIGIGIYFSLPFEPPLISAAALLLATAILYVVAPKNVPVLAVAGLSLAVISGTACAKFRTEWVRAPVLTKPIGPVRAQGFIEKREPRANNRVRLTLRVSSIGRINPRNLPQRIRITTDIQTPTLKPGGFIGVRVKLFPPAGPALPGDYDFARHAWYQQLGAVGYSVSDPQHTNTHETPPLDLQFATYWEKLRSAIGARVTTAIPGQTGAIANALLTGERGGISEQTNDTYRDSGLFHILSISGLHMAIMGGTVFFALRFLLALFPAIALRFPIKKWAAVGAGLAALGYLMISGMAFATVRSFIMIIIMFAAIILDRPAITLRNVAIAALIILVLAPEALLDPGFQMSFAAVAALTTTFEFLNQRKVRVRLWTDRGIFTKIGLALAALCVSTIVASTAVAPFAIYHFHKTQHFALLANLIAVPICNLIVMPSAFATFVAMPFGLERIPLAVMAFGIDQMTACAQWVASLPGAISFVPMIPLSSFIAIVIGGLWLMMLRHKLRLLGLALVAIGVLLAQATTKPDLLVGADARLVAIRGSNGKLTPVSANAAREEFLLSQWLQADGDSRDAQKLLQRKPWFCDKSKCQIKRKGVTIVMAFGRHASNQCVQADILIVNRRNTNDCAGTKLTIGKWDVRDLGTHTIFIGENGKVTLKTTLAQRGDRPWVAINKFAKSKLR